MAKFDSAKRVMSGTWGEVWLDNEYVAEVYSFSAKISYNNRPSHGADRWPTTRR